MVPNMNGDVFQHQAKHQNFINKPITIGRRCCEYLPNSVDMPTYLRHLMGSHPTHTKTIKRVGQELELLVRQEWERIFGGSLKVDFVCGDPTKILLLRDTLSLSDLVPLNFGMDAELNQDQSRFRVVIEV